MSSKQHHPDTHHSHHGHAVHSMGTKAHLCPGGAQVAVKVHDPHADTHQIIHVPGGTRPEGERFVKMVGSGIAGTGAHDLWLGQTLPWIRDNYTRALQGLETEIAQRRMALGPRLKDAGELEQFAKWALGKRNSLARIWRLPAGPGGVLGGEIRDIQKYGPGGRSFGNLMRNAEVKYGQTGVSAMERIAMKASAPNPGETAAILRGAKYLKAGGALLFVGGMTWTAYDIYKAPEGQRMEVAKKEGIGMAGGMVGSNLGVGVCFLLGMTGVGLIAVGLVAGVAGAYYADQMYYAHGHDAGVQGLHERGEANLAGFWPAMRQ